MGILHEYHKNKIFITESNMLIHQFLANTFKFKKAKIMSFYFLLQKLLAKQLDEQYDEIGFFKGEM